MKKKTNTLLILITIFLTGFVTQEQLLLFPVLGNIYEHFPTVNMGLVSMVVTVSTLMIGIVGALIGRLCLKFSKKTLLIVGGIIFTIGGGFGAIVPTIPYMLVMRIIEGIGAGIVINILPTMISDLYPDQDKMEKVMGWNCAASAIWGVIASMLGGYLGLISWQTTYYAFFFTVILIILQIIVIPNDKPARESAAEVKAKVPPAGILLSVAALMFGITTNFYFLNAEALLMEAGSGGSVEAGFANSVVTAASFLAGIVFGYIFKKLKTNSATLCMAALAVGFLLPLLSPAPFVMYVGSFLIGFGIGAYWPYMLAKAAIIASGPAQTATIALVNGLFFLGQFLASFVISAIPFCNASARNGFISGLVCHVVFTVVYLVFALREKAAAKEVKA